jgi:putative acetyltransferase
MIRKYRDEDADAVVASWRVASELAHPFLTTQFLDAEADAVRNVYLAFAETWVMEVDGAVVSFIAIVGNDVGGLFLDPRYHGQGLGRALMDKAVAERGSLNVEVFRENAVGRRFYDAYGFHGAEESIHESSGQVTIRMAFTPA